MRSVPAPCRPHRDAGAACRRWVCLQPGRAVLLVLVVAGVVVALGCPAEATSHALAVVPTVEALLINVRNWIMGILALIATVFISIGGVRYVLANGDPGEVEKAKASLRNAAFGFLLAAAAPVVVDVLRGLVGA